MSETFVNAIAHHSLPFPEHVRCLFAAMLLQLLPVPFLILTFITFLLLAL